MRARRPQPYYLFNQLQFEKPQNHAQDATEPPNSTINAPLHKFRWVHTPGSLHQGLKPFLGRYTYTVTPRYFDANESLLPMDPSKSVTVSVDVLPFKKGRLEVAFTRGFMQSQAFVNHLASRRRFGPRTTSCCMTRLRRPERMPPVNKFSFADEYRWMGYTAREKIFGIVERRAEVEDAAARHVRLRPERARLCWIFCSSWRRKGRVRLILDNAALHHTADNSKPEDEFESLFNKAKKGTPVWSRATSAGMRTTK